MIDKEFLEKELEHYTLLRDFMDDRTTNPKVTMESQRYVHEHNGRIKYIKMLLFKLKHEEKQ